MRRAQLNPTRMGVPKRCPSLNQQLDTFVRKHGGDRPIYRLAKTGDCITQLHRYLDHGLSMENHLRVVLVGTCAGKLLLVQTRSVVPVSLVQISIG